MMGIMAIEKTKDVSIIIVNYNTRQLLADCLASVYEKTDGIDFEVIVSDNGSNDGSVEMIRAEFPEVVLIENGANLGFGAANNRALDEAKGKYVLYLNSDTVLLNNAVKIFFDYFEAHAGENLGAIGCNLKDTEGGYNCSYGKLKSLKSLLKMLFMTLLGNTKRTIQYFFTRKKIEVTFDSKTNFYIGKVDWIIGADLFVRNNTYARFDESFFMFKEEIDLQLCMSKAGLESRIIDGPEIIHLEGGSTDKDKKNYKVFYFATKRHIEQLISQCRFYEKHENKPLQIFLLKIIITLIWLNPLIVKDTYKSIPRLFGKKRATSS